VGGPPAIGANADPKDITDTLLFHTPMPAFLAARNSKLYAHLLDWSSDGCSASPDHPLGFNFLDGCFRHDFGYRNYKRQGRFTEYTRMQIDTNLKEDLYSECNAMHGHAFDAVKRIECHAIADTYYKFVRWFGGATCHMPAIPHIQKMGKD
jgi:hypothetical protein